MTKAKTTRRYWPKPMSALILASTLSIGLAAPSAWAAAPTQPAPDRVHEYQVKGDGTFDHNLIP